MNNQRTARRLRASKSTNSDDPECVGCKTVVTEDLKALECATCQGWECITCANIPETLYDNKDVMESDNLRFICSTCKQVRNKKPKGKSDSSKLDAVLQKLDKLDSVLDKCNNLEDKLSELELNIDTKIDRRVDARVEEVLHSQIAKEVRQCFEEQKQRERRSTNIIIYGAEEPDDEDPADRKRKDEINANSLCSALGVPSANILTTIRIGEKKAERKRPWKIVLDDVKTQKEILRNAWKVANIEEYKSLSINPDMTQEQREERRKLVEILHERRRNGEKDLVIRGGNIVAKKALKPDKEGRKTPNHVDTPETTRMDTPTTSSARRAPSLLGGDFRD